MLANPPPSDDARMIQALKSDTRSLRLQSNNISGRRKDSMEISDKTVDHRAIFWRLFRTICDVIGTSVLYPFKLFVVN